MEYKPFYLDPSIPPEGSDFRAKMSSKGGGQIPPEHFFEAPRRMGERVGLTFNFEDIKRAPNTTLSHCLISLTPAKKVDSLVEDIYAAYFEHGQDIGDIEILLQVAATHGMDTPSLRSQMTEVETQSKVREDVEAAYRLGISGVPFFVIDQKYGFSGAQPPEIITNILKQVSEKEKI